MIFLKSWSNDYEIKTYIVRLLNGDILPVPYEFESCTEFRYENCHVYQGDTKIIRIRGWGYLTGIGGLDLDPNLAMGIQDEFGNFIVDKLYGK